MVEQGYNYLDDSIDFMAEFFQTRIANLEKSISQSVYSRNNRKSKKGSKKRKLVSFNNFYNEDSDQRHTGMKFCQHQGACGHAMDHCTTTLQALAKQAKQKKSKHFDKKKRFTKHEVNVKCRNKLEKLKSKKKRSILRNFVHLRKRVFLILIRNLLAVAPAKKAKFENQAQAPFFNFNNNHRRKKLKKHTESFLHLDNCINANDNYKSLCSRLVSQPNSNKNHNNFISSMQEDLVPITFGEQNSKRLNT